jgi:hypothetical protein
MRERCLETWALIYLLGDELLDLVLGDLRPFDPLDEGDRHFAAEIILHSEENNQESEHSCS